jgi:tetratricopeptide (TPR) repeat protein
MAGQGAEERRVLAEAVDAGTLSAGIFTRLGQLALADGDLPAAEEHLARATSLLPSLAPAWWAWGRAAEAAGASEAALERYRRLLGLDPADLRARLQVGRLLAELGRGAEARPHLEAVGRSDTEPELAREARRLLAGLAEASGSPGP